MSDYTIKNVKKDMEDRAPQFGLSPSLETRFGRSALGCEELGVSYMRFAPGFRTPFGHRHREQEEVYVLIAGGGRMKLDDEVVEIGQWDAIRVPPQVARAFEAGPEGIELIVVGAPVFAESDGEILENWWAD